MHKLIAVVATADHLTRHGPAAARFLAEAWAPLLLVAVGLLLVLGRHRLTRLLADRSRARGRPLDPREEQLVRAMLATYGMVPLLLTAAALVSSLLAA
jgi:hypothetical protein